MFASVWRKESESNGLSYNKFFLFCSESTICSKSECGGGGGSEKKYSRNKSEFSIAFRSQLKIGKYTSLQQQQQPISHARTHKQ